MNKHRHIHEDIVFDGIISLRKIKQLNFESPSGVSMRQFNGKIQFKNEGGEWNDLVTITVGTTPPESPLVGDLWVDTN
jgi:hypothetical protein